MYFQFWKYVIWQQIRNPQNIIHVYSVYIFTKIYLCVLILKVLILIHCFRGQILLLWACLKTDVRVCKKCKGRHANRYLNQKQGREINAKKKDTERNHYANL